MLNEIKIAALVAIAGFPVVMIANYPINICGAC